MLASAAERLTYDEWRLLEKEYSLLIDGIAADTPHGFAAAFADRFPTDQEWHADVEAVRSVIEDEIAGMSQTEYLAIVDILAVLRNPRSDDALFSLSAMIPALGTE